MTITADQVTGVLLAGGQSRRMFAGEAKGGDNVPLPLRDNVPLPLRDNVPLPLRDKGLLGLGAKPMIGHVMARLAPQVGRMVLNANGDPSRFASLGLPVVPDTIAGFVGPLAGVLTGMRWSRDHAPDAPYIATVSTDAPFIPADLVARLGAAMGKDLGRIALARSGGELHPVIGLWPVALADDLEAALNAGLRKVLTWTDRHGTIGVDFPPERIGTREVDPFFNANTPEELAEARAILGS